MQVDTFLKHHGIAENPFSAEEARDDPIFARLLDAGAIHPEFDKVLGDPAQPRPAVVFGEKGSGKTALRLMVERAVERHNARHPDRRAWVVRYDDLNPVIDRFTHHFRRGESSDKLLQRFRLPDHMDAMLSRATTRLVDALLGEDAATLGDDCRRTARRMDRQRRVDLAELAVLYDQPASGNFAGRWARLRRTLRLGRVPWARIVLWSGVGLALLTLGLVAGTWVTGSDDTRLSVATGIAGAAAVLLLAFAAWRWLGAWRLARRVRREVRVVDRSPTQLRAALMQMPARDLADQPVPVPGDHDSRYQLTQRLLGVLGEFGYASGIVLVDRVDEPALVQGDAQRMRALVWPMFDNKFLQQDGVGLKLLLPIELRHLLHREDANFFQQARLDKQHLVDRLTWSGTTLYDLCTQRLQACQQDDAQPLTLAQLFTDEVGNRDLIDALDQMHQPRDAFKFIYQVIQEHCANVPADEPQWQIPRLTLESVRKQQSQRVQEFYRGLSPA